MADERKQALIRELEDARAMAGANRRGLSRDLQVGDKVKASLTRNRGVWLSAAMLFGLIISRLPPKKKVVIEPRGSKSQRELKQVGKAGIGVVVMKMIFDLARPFIMSWITKKVRGGMW
jgi:hypothetical protein